jgi:hypothetical protein
MRPFGQCEYCQYWEPPLSGKGEYGGCHRHAPRAESTDQPREKTNWPYTKASDWCGENVLAKK